MTDNQYIGMHRIQGCGCIDQRLTLFTDEPATEILRTEAPSFFAANSKETLVLVEFRKTN